MLKTPIGAVEILINGKSNNYMTKRLSKRKKNFAVDGRYMVIIDIPAQNNQEIVIECKLIEFTGDDAKGSIESDERLALFSFYRDNIKLSIGIEDEIPNVYCSYID